MVNMKQVQKLGGVPTIGDMGMLVRGAMRTPWPEAVVSLLQHSHKLGYVFGRYDCRLTYILFDVTMHYLM